MIASKDNADWLLVGGAFELVPRRLDHTVIKANEILAASKWRARSNISVIKVLLKYTGRDTPMKCDGEDLMMRHVPTLPLMTADPEPAHTRPSYCRTFIIRFKAWKVKPVTENDLWCLSNPSFFFKCFYNCNCVFDDFFFFGHLISLKITLYNNKYNHTFYVIL